MIRDGPFLQNINLLYSIHSPIRCNVQAGVVAGGQQTLLFRTPDSSHIGSRLASISLGINLKTLHMALNDGTSLGESRQ